MATSSATIHPPRDPNTLSNYNHWLTTHTTVDFSIDFDQKLLTGDVLLRLKSITNAETKEILLDSSYLDVFKVEVDGQKPQGFHILDRVEPYGSAVKIQLQEGVEMGREVDVNDTPDVKSTFKFRIRSPLPVIASGLPTGTHEFKKGEHGKPGTLLYTFKQEIPIPSYLFAIASGDIATASIGPRSVVATGPEELLESKWELERDMETFMEAAEKIVTPYAWTTYNALILPPSFPYGGMENPNFTFATPTIISGDRENVDVIAHELSHSWSGNLVSNASWEHFWLNEGWTTYLERRIQASVHGSDSYRDFSAIIGWKALEDSINLFGPTHEFTKLVINLKGKDPDDAFSSIPYEKGFIFLYHLETLLTQPKFDKFIPYYFTKFACRSLDSYDFKSTLLKFFANDQDATKKLTSLNWDSWFYNPGLPPKPTFDTSLVDVCYALADKWHSLSIDSSGSNQFTPSPSDISSLRANQLVVFLEKIQSWSSPLRTDLVALMGNVYGFPKSKNVELSSRYYVVALRAGYRGVEAGVVDLLSWVGRMKFVRPLYRALNDLNRDLAIKTFEKYKDYYHPICKAAVEKDLFGRKD
ncbi:MAG: hypothetical protein M1834_002394 [Cirrosporium novae-zelandiae]|nr:MAG: hypothetical protein M1834_002394 [Cirrosporium novae-zelandiae]